MPGDPAAGQAGRGTSMAGHGESGWLAESIDSGRDHFRNRVGSVTTPHLQNWHPLWRLKRVRWPVFCLIIAAGVWVAWAYLMNRPEELLEQARDAIWKHNWSQVEILSHRALRGRPGWDEAALLASEAAASQEKWDQALAYLEGVQPSNTQFAAILHTRRATLLDRPLARLDEAEQSFREALKVAPDLTPALSGLAELLAISGRQGEARPLVLRLLQIGGEDNLLMLLARADSGLTNVTLLERARQNRPGDLNPLLGLSRHYLRLEQPHLAEPLLRQALEIDRANLPATAMLGLVLVAEMRAGEFAAWQAGLPPEAAESAEIWLARARMADVVGDKEGAARCYWETLKRQPESRPATVRLANRLAEVGETVAAEEVSKRLESLQNLETLQNRVLFAADDARPEMLVPLAGAYEQAGRLWEALGWLRFASSIGVRTPEVSQGVRRIAARLKTEPLAVVATDANVAARFDLSKFAVPDFRPNGPSVESRASVRVATAYRFGDEAAAKGVSFRFDNGVRGRPTKRVFEFTGGGVAVLDYDGDSWPDLYFPQGLAWPEKEPLPIAEAGAGGGDRLYRNEGGARGRDVTAAAGIVEAEFGQGATSGDFDGDGFADLYVGNFGKNRLWLNRGDGTFEDVTATSGMEMTATPEWTTSVVLADLDGDALPDLYDATYVRGLEAVGKVCRHPDGTPRLCPPSDFDGAPDRLWRNRGDGQVQEATAEVLGEQPTGLGLGVAVWSDGVDAHRAGASPEPRRLAVYVANDTTPSFYFRPVVGTPGQPVLRESAVSAGLAFNAAGKATGCMGVALGDIDGDGRVELYVTNFLAEPSSFFQATSTGFFEDRSRMYGLEKPSYEQLGFGTQFLDVDNDGVVELFVSNGHVDDLTRQGKPHRMPPQLFHYDGAGRFAEIDRATLGEYFAKSWLGRAAARIDWNRDERDDLVVTHLEDDAALVMNRTEGTGQALSLVLVSTGGERDAVGAVVEVIVGGRRTHQQLTTGDGYLCRNERRITIGLGTAEAADTVIVHWMNGRRDEFTGLPAGQYVVREGAKPVTIDGSKDE